MKYILLIFLIFFSACSTRGPGVYRHSYAVVYKKPIPYKNNQKINYHKHDWIYKTESRKLNVNYKIIRAICFTESSGNPFTIHVNNGKYKGAHRFKSKWAAINFIKKYLKHSSYDSGICQINNYWIKKLHISHKKIFDKKFNIRLASKIYKYNLKKCNNDIRCALSMYNTGKKHSDIGMEYANIVLKNNYNISKE